MLKAIIKNQIDKIFSKIQGKKTCKDRMKGLLLISK